jgi:hypothetical protein
VAAGKARQQGGDRLHSS